MSVDFRVWAFLSPETRARIVREEREHEIRTFDNLAKTKPVPWDDMRTKFSKLLFVDAKTWKPRLLFDSPRLTQHPGTLIETKHPGLVHCPGTKFFYANQKIPVKMPISLAQGRNRGKVYFSDTVKTCCLFAKDGIDTTTWMGYTPMEILTQRKGVSLAKGRVVVGGLGLGWFLWRVCLKRTVTEIIVVEREAALLNWLRPALERAYPELRLRGVQWVAADVWDYMDADSKNHANTRYLLDIWPTFPTYDRRLVEWQKRLGKNNVWGWGCLAD